MKNSKLKQAVKKVRDEWPQEKRKELIDAAAFWNGGQQAALGPDQQVTAWFTYYAYAAEKITEDLNDQKFDKIFAPEQQRLIREVARAITLGSGQWTRFINGEQAQQAFAMKCFNKYQEDQLDYDSEKAWEIFKRGVERVMTAVQQDYDLAERDRVSQEEERERQLKAKIAKLVKGNDQRDIDFALQIEGEVNRSGAGPKRVICLLMAPDGQTYRASTSDAAVGYDQRNGIPDWIIANTERLMSKPKGGLRSVLSCSEFKCLVQYMNSAGINGRTIDENSTEDEVSALLGAGGYTIAREINGRNHSPKVACDNCKQWLTMIGWKWAPGNV